MAVAFVGCGLLAAAVIPVGLLKSDPPAVSSNDGDDALCVIHSARVAGLRAFPSAEGFGKFAQGGRGGRVYAVTTLADDGPGSLRACAEASGPRTCVFRVSGTIAVDRWISVQNPYLTIAGQTSPGGIAIRLGQSTNTPLLIQTHDVIVRHIRVRPGPAQTPSENVDTLQISGGAQDVIIDHVSTSWPTDEGINIVGDGHRQRLCRDTRNVTIQWSILSEGLNRANRGAHSRGAYLGYGARDISFNHNLIASNYRRNPLLNTRGQFDLVNNVIYNSGRYNAEFYTRFGDLSVNAIGNVAVLGPSSEKTTRLYLFDYFRDYPAKFAIYLKDNLDSHRRRNTGDERLVLEPGDWSYSVPRPVGELSLAAQTITSPAQAYHDVLAFAGATAPVRDAADVRVLNDMAQCRGAIIDDPEQVGGWPRLDGPPPPSDRDGDGIPDTWEEANGLSADDARDGSAIAVDGYSNLEHYLNGLAGDGAGSRAAASGDPDVNCGFTVQAAPPAPVVQIVARPTVVDRGKGVVLSWSSERAGVCKLMNTVVSGSGERQIMPRKTDAYEIRCVGADGGDAIDSVLVEVKP